MSPIFCDATAVVDEKEVGDAIVFLLHPDGDGADCLPLAPLEPSEMAQQIIGEISKKIIAGNLLLHETKAGYKQFCGYQTMS